MTYPSLKMGGSCGSSEANSLFANAQLCTSALPAGSAGLIAKLLKSPTLRWSQRQSQAAAGRGSVLQLAGPEQHDAESMELVRSIMLSMAWRFAGPLLGGRTPEEIVPQIFPVLMLGDKWSPSSQLPHRDTVEWSGREVHPIFTLIYYFLLDDIVGGELLIVDDVEDGGISVRSTIAPVFDHVVILPGNQLHAVAPLLSGTRGSIVTNLYDAEY